MNKYIAYKCMHERKIVHTIASGDYGDLQIIIEEITESQNGTIIKCDVLDSENYPMKTIERNPDEIYE